MPEEQIRVVEGGVSQSLDTLHRSFLEKRNGGDVEGTLAGFADIAREVRSGIFRSPEDFYQTIGLSLDCEFPIAEAGIDRAVDVALGAEGDVYRDSILQIFMQRIDEIAKSYGQAGMGANELYGNITTSAPPMHRILDMREIRSERASDLSTYQPVNEDVVAHRIVVGIARILAGKGSVNGLEPEVREKMLTLCEKHGGITGPMSGASEVVGRIATDETVVQNETCVRRVRSRFPEVYRSLFGVQYYFRYIPGLSRLYDWIQQPNSEPDAQEIKYFADKHLMNLGMNYLQLPEK